MSEDRLLAYDRRAAELKKLDDEALKARFWELSEQLVAPIVDLARTHTSPSIERSVLLRMGIDSVSTHGIVDRVAEAGLLGKGAGHVVLKLSRKHGCDLRAAGRMILDDASCLDGLFDATPATSDSKGEPR